MYSASPVQVPPFNGALAPHSPVTKAKLQQLLTVKGVADPVMLFEAPFTDLNSSGIMSVFDEATSARIIDLLEEVNRNAEVA